MRELTRIARRAAALELEEDAAISDRRAHEDDVGAADARQAKDRLGEPVTAGARLDEDRVARELLG